MQWASPCLEFSQRFIKLASLVKIKEVEGGGCCCWLIYWLMYEYMAFIHIRDWCEFHHSLARRGRPRTYSSYITRALICSNFQFPHARRGHHLQLLRAAHAAHVSQLPAGRRDGPALLAHAFPHAGARVSLCIFYYCSYKSIQSLFACGCDNLCL